MKIRLSEKQLYNLTVVVILSLMVLIIQGPPIIISFSHATTSLAQSLQNSQHELQSSINTGVQQTIDNTNFSINTNVNTNSNNSTLVNSTTDSNNLIKNDMLFTKLLSKNIENHLEKAGAILEITSKLPQVRDISYVNLINSSIHGIPQNADIEKREIAKYILSKYNEDFVAFNFILPNGDVYMIEPYSLQEKLSTSNLAFRDYFKGAINTQNIYLGNIITSVASGITQIRIAIPIYSNDSIGRNMTSADHSSSLTGIWTAGLNIEYYNKLLQSLDLTSSNGKDTRIVFLDANGIKIADSDKNQTSSLSGKTNHESFATLQSFKNAVKGQSGSIVDNIENKKMLVIYNPVKAFNNTLVILLLQPVNSTIN